MFEPLRWRIFAAWVVTGLLLAPMPSRTRGLLVQFHRASAKPVSCWQQSQAPGPCAVRLACWNRPRPALKTVHTISIDQRALHTYEADGGCTADRAGGRTVAAQAPNPGGSRAGVGRRLRQTLKPQGRAAWRAGVDRPGQQYCQRRAARIAIVADLQNEDKTGYWQNAVRSAPSPASDGGPTPPARHLLLGLRCSAPRSRLSPIGKPHRTTPWLSKRPLR